MENRQTISYSVSGREKLENQHILDYLKLNYYKKEPITSIFGFVEYSPLYAGRVFTKPDLTSIDIKNMYDNNIALELPMANQYWNENDYYESLDVLKKYHRVGNVALLNGKRGVPTNYFCSKILGVKREDLGFVEFDIKQLNDLGFKRFKLLRYNPFDRFYHAF